MANEEISVSFGASTEGFDAALAKVKRSSREAGEHAHGSFVHASNGAKQFHRVLHEITAQSPLLGGALQAAISPVAGLFIAAGIAVEAVKERLAEFNKEADKTTADAAKPLSDIGEIMRKNRKEAEEFDRQWDKNAKEHDKKDTISEILEKRIELLRNQRKEAEKNQDELVRQANEQSADKTGKKKGAKTKSTKIETDKDAIDADQTRAEIGLQNAALAELAQEKAKADAKSKAAAAEHKSNLLNPKIGQAEGAIEAEKEKQKEAQSKINELENKRGRGFGIGDYIGAVRDRKGPSQSEQIMSALKERKGFGAFLKAVLAPDKGKSTTPSEKLDEEQMGAVAAKRESEARQKQQESALDAQEARTRDSAEKSKEADKNRNKIAADIAKITAARDANRLKLAARKISGPDMRVSTQISADDAVNNSQQAYDEYLEKANKANTGMYDKLFPNLNKDSMQQALSKENTTPSQDNQNIQQFQQWLQNMLQAGVRVKPMD